MERVRRSCESHGIITSSVSRRALATSVEIASFGQGRVWCTLPRLVFSHPGTSMTSCCLSSACWRCFLHVWPQWCPTTHPCIRIVWTEHIVGGSHLPGVLCAKGGSARDVLRLMNNEFYSDTHLWSGPRFAKKEQKKLSVVGVKGNSAQLLDTHMV